MDTQDWLPTSSTIKHLRFLHSFSLTPVFFFALAQNPSANLVSALALFLILAVAIFPASHGFNSYYDRDKGSIGGLEKPPMVDSQLLTIAVGLETLGLALTAICFGPIPTIALIAYGIASKLYSHPAVRLKAMPWISLLVVATFQGPVIYWLVNQTTANGTSLFLDNLGLVVSFFMVVAAYPLTQIYQHDEDRQRGDLTLSRLFGIRGTFIFSMSCLSVALGALLLLSVDLRWLAFILLQLPAGIRLLRWAHASWKTPSEANYKNAASCLNTLTLTSSVGFISMFLVGRFS